MSSTTLIKTNPVWQHTPSCPLCFKPKMEFVQMIFAPWKESGTQSFWQETWNCDGCHTNHTFPARLEVMEAIKGSKDIDASRRSLYLPK